MPGFDLRWKWLDAPDADEAFGPERATWAELTIEMSGATVTSHRRLADGDRVESAVVGSMSGIADWLVENWLFLSWESHTPFPKTTGDRDSFVPTLEDAREGRAGDVQIASLARWLHRHTLGHGTSDLAVPSVTFLPEDRAIGVYAAPPPHHLKPTVRFEEWPSRELVWMARDELLSALQSLIDETIARAKGVPEAGAWAEWLGRRFAKAREQSADAEVRRRLMLGELVASNWERLKSELGNNDEALFGVLVDADFVESDADLSFVARAVRTALSRAGGGTEWRSIKSESGEHLLPPYERGYRIARRVRAFLNEPVNPLLDLKATLMRLGVTVDATSGGAPFRSACVADREGHSTVLYVEDHPRFGGLAPTRFAVAAALGRLLGEGAGTQAPFGAAISAQSRLRATQQANAFAAELLLPLEALRRSSEDLTSISEDYGISRLAAERHRSNLLA